MEKEPPIAKYEHTLIGLVRNQLQIYKQTDVIEPGMLLAYRGPGNLSREALVILSRKPIRASNQQ